MNEITQVERRYRYDLQGRLVEVSERARVIRVGYDVSDNATSVEVIAGDQPSGREAEGVDS